MIKYYLTNLLRGGESDRYFAQHVERCLPPQAFQRVQRVEWADVIFVVVVDPRREEVDAAAAAAVGDSGKPMVVFDYFEAGAARFSSQPGFERLNTLLSQNLAWFRRHFARRRSLLRVVEFLNRHSSSIALYFKRELLRDRSVYEATRYPLLPLDYTSSAPAPTPVSRADFLARPIDLTMIYGMSNKSRPKLHAKYLSEWGSRIAFVANHADDAREFLSAGKSGIYFFMLAAPTRRIQQSEFFEKSVLTLDMHGNGVKCFRNAEACRSSIPVRQDTSVLEYVHEWVDGVNCIVIPNLHDCLVVDEDAAFEKIQAALRRKSELYDIYLQACHMAQLYEARRYAVEHLGKNILNALGAPAAESDALSPCAVQVYQLDAERNEDAGGRPVVHAPATVPRASGAPALPKHRSSWGRVRTW